MKIIHQNNTFRCVFHVIKRFCSLEVRSVNNNDDVLHSTSEDLSSVTPYFSKSFNLAAYVNNSITLQNLLHLNVNLSRIEKKPYVAEKILQLDYEQDIKKHIWFLSDYIGSDELGPFLTKNPMILCEDINNLQTRVNYLLSKKFHELQIKRIISKDPFWLMFSTVRIDKRLGYYQANFDLSGDEVKYLTTKQPRIITYNLHHIKTNTFAIKEEMGFKDEEVKKLILHKPKVWMLNQSSLRERFNFLHNEIKIPHDRIIQNPEVLMTRKFRMKQRHLFLEKLGRAQYDPKKENYIPLKALGEDTDKDFCKKYAKCNVVDFNSFLKTL